MKKYTFRISKRVENSHYTDTMHIVILAESSHAAWISLGFDMDFTDILRLELAEAIECKK